MIYECPVKIGNNEYLCLIKPSQNSTKFWIEVWNESICLAGSGSGDDYITLFSHGMPIGEQSECKQAMSIAANRYTSKQLQRVIDDWSGIHNQSWHKIHLQVLLFPQHWVVSWSVICGFHDWGSCPLCEWNSKLGRKKRYTEALNKVLSMYSVKQCQSVIDDGWYHYTIQRHPLFVFHKSTGIPFHVCLGVNNGRVHVCSNR